MKSVPDKKKKNQKIFSKYLYVGHSKCLHLQKEKKNGE